MKLTWKKPMMIISAVFAGIFIVLASIPFFYQEKIELLVKKQLNEMMNAHVDFSQANLSLIRQFPNLSVKLEDFEIVGIDEFKQDTLVYSKNIDLVMDIKSLFNDDGYDIKKLIFNDSKVKIRVLTSGKANWDIMKPDSPSVVDTSAWKFKLKLKQFEINHADFAYHYEKGAMIFLLKDIVHSLNGDLTADSSMLITQTHAESFSFIWDDFAYVSEAEAQLNANINVDLNDMRFEFSENQSRLNAFPFEFKGWLQSLPDGWDMDLSIESPQNEFNTILSLIPAIYNESFSDLKSGGNVQLKGFLKGEMVGDYYPTFGLKMLIQDGWFQYPSLPQKMDAVQMNLEVVNMGKTLDETIVDLKNFSFKMAGMPFALSAYVAKPMSDTEFKFSARGKLDLAKVKDFYPIESTTSLNGLIHTDISLNGKMSYIDHSNYDLLDFKGILDIQNMLVHMDGSKDLSVKNAGINFNSKFVELNQLQVNYGKSDLQANGKLNNLVGYVLKDQLLSGQLNLRSNSLDMNEFMVQDSPDVNSKADSLSSSMSVIQIPGNIQFDMTADISQLKYQQMTFTDAKGKMIVKDKTLSLKDIEMKGFGGQVIMNGLYDTRDTLKPNVDMNLMVQEVEFMKIFQQVDMFRKIAPIFEKASGKFSSTLTLNSTLGNDMMPDLTTLFSKGNLTTSSIGLKDVKVLDLLASQLKNKEIIPMIIKNLKLLFEIKDGKLTTKPFNFTVANMGFTVDGITGLDQSIDYKGIIQMPDKFNLGKFSKVNLLIGGTFQKPTVKIDMQEQLESVKTEVHAKAKAVVDQKLNEVKTELNKKREILVQQATAKADLLKIEAQKAGEKLIAEAQNRSDQLVAKATNPITKKAAELTATKMMSEARLKADQLYKEAVKEGDALILKAQQTEIK